MPIVLSDIDKQIGPMVLALGSAIGKNPIVTGVIIAILICFIVFIVFKDVSGMNNPMYRMARIFFYTLFVIIPLLFIQNNFIISEVKTGAGEGQIVIQSPAVTSAQLALHNAPEIHFNAANTGLVVDTSVHHHVNEGLTV